MIRVKIRVRVRVRVRVGGRVRVRVWDRVRVRVSRHALVELPWHIYCYISPISRLHLAYISPNLGGLAVAHL